MNWSRSDPDGGPVTGQARWVRTAALSEPQAVVITVSAWVAALHAPRWANPWWFLVSCLAMSAVALPVRSPLLLLIGVVGCVASSGARAEAGHVPMADGPVASGAIVVGDPERRGARWSIELRLDGGARVEAVGYGMVADRIAGATVGDHVDVRGSVRPIPTGTWKADRHLVGRVDLVEVVPRPDRRSLPSVAAVAPRFLRDRIDAGAETLSFERRALYTGLVMGDDRFQSPAQRLKFRRAGLTHLLAVSGQSVSTPCMLNLCVQ